MFEELVAVLPSDHWAVNKKSIALADLRDDSWVFFPLANVARVSVEAETAALDFSPNVEFVTRDYQVIHVLVGSGLGVAVLPQLMVPEFDLRRVAVRPLRNTSLGRELFLVTRSSYASPAVETFIGLVSNDFAKTGSSRRKRR